MVKAVLRVSITSAAAQIVEAVSGAVEGLRDQLEALTILDETALTWPGLSLVSCLRTPCLTALLTCLFETAARVQH